MIEKVMSAVFLLFCLVYMFFAKDMTFGSLTSPKSGFLPLVAGMGGTVLSLINLVKVLFTKNEKTDTQGLKKLGMFFGGLVVYLLILPYIGYLISTTLIMFFLLKVTDTKGWVVPASVSVGVGVGFYFIFAYSLGVMLP